MNLQNEIQQIKDAEKGCEVKKALAGALRKVEREFNKSEETVYIHERITNISVLEYLIGNARFNFSILENELEKATPSTAIIESAAYQIRDSLKKAESFEFCIEERKCRTKDFSVNPVSVDIKEINRQLATDFESTRV